MDLEQKLEMEWKKSQLPEPKFVIRKRRQRAREAVARFHIRRKLILGIEIPELSIDKEIFDRILKQETEIITKG